MKLLLYAADDEVDQVLMVVPDEFDSKFADEQAEDILPSCYREGEWQILDDTAVATYRPYVG